MIRLIRRLVPLTLFVAVTVTLVVTGGTGCQATSFVRTAGMAVLKFFCPVCLRRNLWTMARTFFGLGGPDVSRS